MHRVVVSPQDVDGGVVAVRNSREVHHLRDVRRVKVGDRVECVDGAGRGYAGLIIRCAREEVLIQVEERREEPARRVMITLAQAMIKPERFEWVLQKATELGVDVLLPLMTQRTIARPPTSRLGGRLERWRRIVSEAAKQCGRGTLPRVEMPQALPEALAGCRGCATILLPTLAVPARPIHEALANGELQPTSLAVLIGPEGDFTREEVVCAQQERAQPVSLGRLTLRSETAALVTLAILQYRLGVL